MSFSIRSQDESKWRRQVAVLALVFVGIAAIVVFNVTGVRIAELGVASIVCGALLLVFFLLAALTKPRSAGFTELFKILTEVWIAGLLALLFSLFAYSVLHEGGGHVTEHVVKEAFFASLVGIVVFTAAAVARVLSAFEKVRSLDDILENANIIASKHRELLGQAKIVAADATAGSAMARLLNVSDGWPYLTSRDDEAEPASKQRWISSLTELFSGLGQVGTNWTKFARELRDRTVPLDGDRNDEQNGAAGEEVRPDPDGGDEDSAEPKVVNRAAVDRLADERAGLMLRVGAAFALEMASDIGRHERLIVANIRYVTRLICAALFELSDAAAERGDGWKPFWLALTSFKPSLWFCPDGLAPRPYCKDLLHLLYWGRYLRVASVAGSETVHVRLFCNSDGVQDLTQGSCRVDLGLLGGKLLYQGKSSVAAEVAKTLAKAATDAIRDCDDVKDRLPSRFKQALDASTLDSVKNPPESAAELREWWNELEVLERLFPDAELKDVDLAGALPGTGDKYKNVTIDGGPFEVLLDALLIAGEAKKMQRLSENKVNLDTLPKAFVERWHASGTGLSSAYIANAKMQLAAAAPTDTVTDSACRIVNDLGDGDVHSFGLVRVKAGKPDWNEAVFHLCIKSEMAAELSIARVDFVGLARDGSIERDEFCVDRKPLDLRKVAAELCNVHSGGEGWGNGKVKAFK